MSMFMSIKNMYLRWSPADPIVSLRNALGDNDALFVLAAA